MEFDEVARVYAAEVLKVDLTYVDRVEWEYDSGSGCPSCGYDAHISWRAVWTQRPPTEPVYNRESSSWWSVDPEEVPEMLRRFVAIANHVPA